MERAEKAAIIEIVEKLARGLDVEALELFRFSGGDKDEQSPSARLARKVASLAQGKNAPTVERFERLARVYFEPGLSVTEKEGRSRPRAR